MAVPISLCLSKLPFLPKPKQTQLAFTPKDPNFLFSARKKTHFPSPINSNSSEKLKNAATILGLSGLAFTTLMVGSASGSELAILGSSSFQFSEPSNALSLHTWASHVSSVVECSMNPPMLCHYTLGLVMFPVLLNVPYSTIAHWMCWVRNLLFLLIRVTAMALVWQYGEKSGYESWKGLAWGMVPLLGGALCACTWHFFYNSESLEVVVALQAALTVIGNATMCFAAFRIYRSSQKQSKKL